MENLQDVRDLLKDQLLAFKEKALKTQIFHEELQKHVPAEDFWKFETQLTADEFVPPGTIRPVEYLAQVIELLDVVIELLSSSTDFELAAFFLGLGFRGIDLPFLSMSNTQSRIEATQKSLQFYKELLGKKVLKEDLWKFEKTIYNPLAQGYVPPTEVDPREYLEQRLQLLKAQLRVLSLIYSSYTETP